MNTYSLVVKVSDRSLDPLYRTVEAERYVLRELPEVPLTWLINTTSEPTQMTVVVTSEVSLKDRLVRWMHRLPSHPPFEPGSLVFYRERE